MFFKNDYEFCVNEEVKHYGGDRDGLIFRDRIDQEIFNYSHVSYGYKFTTIEMTRPNCNLKLLYFVAIPQESKWEDFKDEILADFEIRFLKCKTIFEKFMGTEVGANNWISVKDSLPSDSTFVIAYGIGKNEETHRVIGGIAFKNGKFWDFDTISNHPLGIISDFMELESVTHWMPLPEPPK